MEHPNSVRLKIKFLKLSKNKTKIKRIRRVITNRIFKSGKLPRLLRRAIIVHRSERIE